MPHKTKTELDRRTTYLCESFLSYPNLRFALDSLLVQVKREMRLETESDAMAAISQTAHYRIIQLLEIEQESDRAQLKVRLTTELAAEGKQ